MGEFLRNLFASDLMPHGRCWAWEPWVVWSNVVPDAVIALSYFAISLTLLHVVRRRRDVALHWVASLFGAFIFACGITHAMEVYNTWHGVFRLAGALKGLTALLSLATAALLAAMAPKLEKVPGLDQAIQMKNTLTTERGERRVAERQLQESQERLRLLIEGVKEYALFMIDPQGLVVSWNPGAERIMGFTAQDIVGHPSSWFYPPEDVTAGKPLHALAMAEAEGTFRDQGWRVRKDGERFQASVAITALRDAQGRLKGYAKVLRDVTQQLEAEAQLEASAHNLETLVEARTRDLRETQARLQGFIHHAPAAIAFKGLDGAYLLLNPRMATLLAQPPEAILGRTDEELFSPEIGRILRSVDQRILDSGQPAELEEQWTHADGMRHEYLTQRFPLVDAQGTGWGLGTISTDITERKEADRTLLQSQKLESMGILAGGIAHDFNNLLGAILGNLGLAQMEISPMAPARARLETIENLVLRASDLTRQMLAYSGRGKFQVKSLNMNDLVKEMTHLLGISISKKAVMRFDLDATIPNVEADPAQIQQVIMNLVINASDAIGERSGSITLRTGLITVDETLAKAFDGQALEQGPFVALEVADTGSGMTPETMKRIFDPFFTTKFTGRGLGLAAIQGIVRGHKGGIRVYSEPGRGTTFRLLFPATTLPPEVPVPKSSVDAFKGHGTVLVVDDEESIRAMAVNILTQIGFQTLQAADGLEALRLYDDHQGDIRLILMDLTMPHLDGEETYRALRHRGSRTPVILSSGFSETEAVNRFMGKGLAGFLQKPYRSVTLVEMVREALERGAKDPSS